MILAVAFIADGLSRRCECLRRRHCIERDRQLPRPPLICRHASDFAVDTPGAHDMATYLLLCTSFDDDRRATSEQARPIAAAPAGDLLLARLGTPSRLHACRSRQVSADAFAAEAGSAPRDAMWCTFYIFIGLFL